MTRIRQQAIPAKNIDALELIIGPTEGKYTEEQLEVAWRANREEVLADLSTGRSVPGFRPWAYWKFELAEEPHQDHEPIRLAELGLLRDEEIAAIAERANEARARIGSTAEHVTADVEVVKLYEAVKRALG